MLDAVKKAGVVHMICHNYRRAPAVQLARQMIEDGKLGKIFHYRGTYLQDWIVDPDFPRVWRLEKAKAGSGTLGDLSSHSIDLARMLVGEIAEVSGYLHTFIKERPMPDGKGRGKVDVDDAALSMVKFDERRHRHDRGHALRPGPQELQPVRDQRQQGQPGLQPRADERARRSTSRKAADSGWNDILVTDAKHPYVAGWWPPGHIIGYEHTFVHTVLDLLEGRRGRQAPQPQLRGRRAEPEGARRPREVGGVGKWERV